MSVDIDDDWMIDVPETRVFVGRLAESRILASELHALDALVADPKVVSGTKSNVMCFHAVSGMGKSQLSSRMLDWLEGEISPSGLWGASPDVPNVVTAKWDLHSSYGDVDIPALLLAVRTALGRLRPRWQALDLALVAYLQAAQPGQNFTFTGHAEAGETLMGLAQGVIDDAGSLIDMGTGVTAWAMQQAVRALGRQLDEHTKRRFRGLDQLLERCWAEVSPSSPSPALAAQILRLATKEIVSLNPTERPRLVVFIDHFERLQLNGVRSGEGTVNRLIRAMPLSLFVVTGQRALTWYRPQSTHLHFRGPEEWPRLRPDDPETMQHELAALPRHDARALLAIRSRQDGFVVSPEALDRLSAASQWPVHLDAVCQLATSMSSDADHPLTWQQLDGPLPELVQKLIAGLSLAEARAFHAACLLPSFTVDIVRVMAEVHEGDVHGCIRRAMVMAGDPPFPYRVHDSVRRVVRQAGPDVAGGWTDGDWKAAATRGMDHARRRLETAREIGDDVGQTHGIALALTLAAEEGLHDPWLNDAVRAAPTMEGLSTWIPTTSANPETQALLDLIHALGRRNDERALGQLQSVYQGSSLASRSAGLWRAYRLRSWGRRDEAVAQLAALAERYPDWAIPRRQLAVTLAEDRRFADAMEAVSDLDREATDYIAYFVKEQHGEVTGLEERYRHRINQAPGRRYQLELESALLLLRARTGRAGVLEVTHLLKSSVNSSNLLAQGRCLLSLGYCQLDDPASLVETASELEDLGFVRSPEGTFWAAELLALRALLTREPQDVDRAHDMAAAVPDRSCYWIPTEMYLEECGRPLTPRSTQWTEPREEVHSRWLAMADGILGRVKESR